MVEGNKSLGKLELHGLPPSPRGVPEIEVTFEIDANGIMHVRAKDLGTGKAQSMRIVSSSGLTDGEIAQMVEDADLYRAEDKRRREVAESKNKLDGLIYNTSRSFEEFGDNLDPDARDALQQALTEAEGAMESSELDVVEGAHDALFEAAQRLAEAIYGGLRESIANEGEPGWGDRGEEDRTGG
jgi:molecular chaperone DnaK